jgi:hypothetical protein
MTPYTVVDTLGELASGHLTFHPEDVGNMFYRNVDSYMADHKLSCPKINNRNIH